MTTVSITDLKAGLSAFLDIVRGGNEVLVTDRGRPIARLIPVRGEELAEGRREMLQRSGRLHGPSTALPADYWTRPRPADADGHSLRSILDERNDAR
jgi:prevent-host-death family protein